MVVLDAPGSVLAVACQSPEDERAVIASEQRQRAARAARRRRAASASSATARGAPSRRRRCCGWWPTLIGLELDRAQAPERASEAAVGDFLDDLSRASSPTARTSSPARGELGCDLADGASRARGARPAPAHRGGRLARPGADGRRARRARRRAHGARRTSCRARGCAPRPRGSRERASTARARDRGARPRRRPGKRVAAAVHASSRPRSPATPSPWP